MVEGADPLKEFKMTGQTELEYLMMREAEERQLGVTTNDAIARYIHFENATRYGDAASQLSGSAGRIAS